MSTPRPAHDVGRRIRELRTTSGLSLGALAGASRLGKGTLSELERGQRNPTLDTLYAISTALGVPLSALLTEAAGSPGRTTPSTPVTRGTSVEAVLLDRWTEPAGLTEVYRVVLGVRLQRSEPHLSGVVETLTVTDGTAEVGTVADPVVISDMQTHTFPGDVPHRYRALDAPATGVLTIRYPAPRVGRAPTLES